MNTHTCKCQAGNVTINGMEFYSNLIRSNKEYLNNPCVKALKKQLKDAGEFVPFDENAAMDLELVAS